MAVAALAVSLVATGYSAYKQNQAARNAASVDTAAADYNAKVDEAQANQIQLDTLQNIRTQRSENAVYLSQQEASYAAAGVLTSGGSPLHAMITNAGRMEQQLQQEYTNSQQKQQQLHSSANIGRLEGEAQAYADKQRGTMALIDGGAKMVSQLYGGYKAGTFDFLKKKPKGG